MGPTRTFSRGTNQEIQWLPTTISVTCGEPKCACHAARKKKPNSCPALEGQVHLSGDTQYVRALGKIFEAGGQPVKNREMKSLAQRGNQAKFFHRMPGVQRSPIAYNLQHLREYNSCRIWASQSRRPPYVAARTDRRCDGVDTRKLHGRSRQQGGRRRCLQESLRCDHLGRGPTIPGSPVEAWEQASDNGSISRQSEQPSRVSFAERDLPLTSSSIHFLIKHLRHDA